MYTSGTTGNPKGVMLTNGCIISGVSAIEPAFGEIKASDVYLSYLPLAHIYERMTIVALIGAGASAGFYQGDPKLIVDDVSCLKPTIFNGVPKIYERVKTVVNSNLKGFKKVLFEAAYKSKKKCF